MLAHLEIGWWLHAADLRGVPPHHTTMLVGMQARGATPPYEHLPFPGRGLAIC